MTLNSNENVTVSNVDELVLSGIQILLEKRNEGSWNGTMTDLNYALTKVLGGKKSSFLPRSPSSLRIVLNRVINRLRNRKISVKFGRTPDHNRTRYVKFAF